MGTNASFLSAPLLPYERQLLAVAGLTESEYRNFVAEAWRRSRVRPAAYDAIPDVQAGDFGISLLVSVLVGAVFTAASYLLTPKPKPPRSPEQITQRTLESITGGSRFAPVFGFDSQAELATYGDPIPIIFGRYTGDSGGILISPRLVWSRMFSYGTQQGVKLLFVVGEQGVAEGIAPDGIDPPALQGIFLGNGSLDSIYYSTFAFYWKRNTTTSGFNRVQAVNLLYGTRGSRASGDPETHNDIYSCPTAVSQNDTGFSAAHSLSNNADFGCYAPIANGSGYRVNWRIISMPALENQDDDPGDNLAYERVKIAGQGGRDVISTVRRLGMPGVGRNYSRRMGLTAINGVGVSDAAGLAVRTVALNDTATFTIAFNQIPDNFYKGKNREVSVQEINDALNEERIAADEALQLGELFMIGSTTWQVTSRSLAIWRPEDNTDQVIELKCIDVAPQATNTVGVISNYMLRANYLFDTTDESVYNAGAAFFPLMRFAKATVRNTRPCEVTEIGLRSNVYQRLNGICNFQTVPTPSQLIALDNKRIQLTTGTNSSFIRRASVFTLYLRPAGLNPSGQPYEWQPINQDFCIIGNQPVDQYNFLRVEHPQRQQYEYQLVPRNGAYIGRNLPDTAQFWHLYAASGESGALSGNYSTAYGTFKLSSIGQVVNKLDIQRNAEFQSAPSSGSRTVITSYPSAVGIYSLLPDEEERQTRIASSEFLSNYTEPSYDYTGGRSGSWTWQLTNEAGVGSADNHPTSEGGIVEFVVRHDITGDRWYRARYRYQKVRLPAGHFSGQTFTWLPLEESILESSKNWDSLSEFTISRSVSGGNPFRTPPASPTLTRIGERRRVTSVISENNVQGRSQAWYEELFGPARNFATGVQRSQTLNKTLGDKTVRLTLSSRVIDSPGHWSGQSKTWEAPVIQVVPDDEYTSTDWQVGNRFQDLRTVSNNNPFRKSGTQVGADFIVEGVTKRIERDPIKDDGRVFEGQSQYADLSFYGNLVEKSNQSNPEHSVAYVNELVSNEQTPNYSYMTLAGLVLKASRNFTALDQIRVWLKNGIPVRRFHPDESATLEPSNLFCDLVYYLLTDRIAGAGEALNMSIDNAPLVNTDDLVRTARFLKSNRLFFDGAISSSSNLRQFVAETAPFMLCNFVIADGKFSLQPALPTQVNGEISLNPAPIKQLFTAGNILEDTFQLTYLAAEERKNFQAVMRYREERENQLPQERNIVVRWNESASSDYPLESFDMTPYCTSRHHAELVARFFLSIRRRITHTVQFKTTPFGIELAPGDYIRVVTEANPYSAAQNGSISAGGVITSATTFADGSYNVIYYKSGSDDVLNAVMTVSSGLVQESALRGSIFTVVNSTVSQNVYLVEQLTLDSDNTVQITASEFPCDSNFSSLIAQDVANASRFLVDS